MAEVAPVTLRDSKLFTMAKAQQLLAYMIPDIRVMMGAEVEISENHPRTEKDGDATRILMNFRTLKGDDIVFVELDNERLDSTFTIDDFMNGYMSAIAPEDVSSDPVDNINVVLLSALNMSASVATGIDRKGQQILGVSKKVLKALVSIIYDDPLDVFISMQERAPAEGQDTSDVIIQAMWAVKKRPE
jgi:hypothetical protein